MHRCCKWEAHSLFPWERRSVPSKSLSGAIYWWSWCLLKAVRHLWSVREEASCQGRSWWAEADAGWFSSHRMILCCSQKTSPAVITYHRLNCWNEFIADLVIGSIRGLKLRANFWETERKHKRWLLHTMTSYPIGLQILWSTMTMKIDSEDFRGFTVFTHYTKSISLVNAWSVKNCIQWKYFKSLIEEMLQQNHYTMAYKENPDVLLTSREKV